MIIMTMMTSILKTIICLHLLWLLATHSYLFYYDPSLLFPENLHGSQAPRIFFSAAVRLDSARSQKPWVCRPNGEAQAVMV